MRAICGVKKLMSRIFDEKGTEIPVTIIEVKENTVTSKKTVEKDGYQALQVACGSKRKINKPLKGQLKNLDIKPSRLYEVKTDKDMNVGENIGLDTFKENEKINVTAVSKGKGFAGTVKRHHFNTGPKTHGSNNYRQPGSIGDTGPQRVVKGRRMAGHLGYDQVTTKNLEIVKIEPENSLLYIKGAVPGPAKSSILIWSENEG